MFRVTRRIIWLTFATAAAFLPIKVLLWTAGSIVFTLLACGGAAAAALLYEAWKPIP